ncbi:hypothetical protein SELMODRAFT_431476 [Selaginella moellendorffii]|uniref:CASP-like protein n=1 Tax=Selaginella moellendorffii TaxID=88036 RepID=D8TCS5_SELML|nr:hypothetical protein SELMODRAFT_431476 [Selaginella moellendorffii]
MEDDYRYYQLGLRVLGFALTSVAFSCMGAALPVSPTSLTSYASFNFLLATNVLACLYSGAQVAVLAANRKKLTDFYKTSSLILDQIFTCLLLASASAASAAFQALELCKQDLATCLRVTSSVVAGFVAFSALYASTVVSFLTARAIELSSRDHPPPPDHAHSSA